jgi:tetratricopeptide (TPR) repeat protein
MAELPRPSSPRNHLLESAIGEFGYTLKHCQNPNAAMKPEILTNLGRAYIGLKQYDNGVKVLTEAIRRNPKYEAAYAELSGIFILLNSPDDARKVLQDGVKAIPNSRLLQVRLKRLTGPGGKGDTDPPGQTGDKGDAGAKTPAGDKQTQRP